MAPKLGGQGRDRVAHWTLRVTEDVLEQTRHWYPGGLEVVRVQPGGAQSLKVWNLVGTPSCVEYGGCQRVVICFPIEVT